MRKLEGSLVALVTPFHADHSVNYEVLGQLLDWHISSGTDGVVILGTTGESSTMTHTQDDEVCQFTIDRVAGRIPVVAGVGSNSTETQADKAARYSAMGADALLAITPYYVKANDEGMYRHFAETANRATAPILLYNVPSRTGCTLSVEVVARLAKHPNILGIKEASGDVGYGAKLACLLSDDFLLFSGNDDVTVPLLSLGASGVISVWANIMPKACHDMVTAYLTGDVGTARRIQLEHLELINNLFLEVNPIPVKEALNLMGFRVGGYNLPLTPMSRHNQAILCQSMIQMGLLEGRQRRCACS